MKRYIVTFYRGKWLYLFVLLVLLGATALAAHFFSAGYEATARIWVDRPTLIQAIDENPYRFFQTPAEEQGDMLHALIQTDTFVTATLRGTELEQRLTGDPNVDRRVIRPVRDNLWQRVLGPNTIEIVHLGDDPVVSQRIVENAVEEFRSWVFDLRYEISTAEIEFYQEQLRIYHVRAEEARLELEQFAVAHPEPNPVSVEYLEYQRLQREYESARSRYAAATTQLNEAEMISTLGSRYGSAEFRVLDPPTVSQFRIATLPRQLRWVLPGTFGSFAIVLGAVVLATWRDRSIRDTDDLRRLSDRPVIGTIPPLKLSDQHPAAQTDTEATSARSFRTAERYSD